MLVGCCVPEKAIAKTERDEKWGRKLCMMERRKERKGEGREKKFFMS